jgi:hypothetical protein
MWEFSLIELLTYSWPLIDSLSVENPVCEVFTKYIYMVSE